MELRGLIQTGFEKPRQQQYAEGTLSADSLRDGMSEHFAELHSDPRALLSEEQFSDCRRVFLPSTGL